MSHPTSPLWTNFPHLSKDARRCSVILSEPGRSQGSEDRIPPTENRTPWEHEGTGERACAGTSTTQGTTSTPHGCGEGGAQETDDGGWLRNQLDPSAPHIFEPNKIKSMGFALSSNGIPSIYFSGSETQHLADHLGHAIVGKFSHSILATNQIQKAFENMKLKCGYSWMYINAKHVLIQLEDLGDYARILNGSKDTPVWFVDRHPMRVFKWTPEFDVYYESPIAAIWCNLIGHPIHLFDYSALFAIGKLLGNPIQIDRATANRSRVSFARICVEIDIVKPVPEEIVLDICGRVSIQQVKWD